MFSLRSLLFSLACALALIVPDQATAMLGGLGPKCETLHANLVVLIEGESAPAEPDAFVGWCGSFLAVQPSVSAVETIAPTPEQTPPMRTAPLTGGHPAGIERPPQA